MNLFSLFKTVERIATKGWRGILESARRVMGLNTRVLLCVFGRLRKGHCLAVYSMSKSIIRLYRSSGPLFTGQYLKHVALVLMWYVGGNVSERPPFKVLVKTTRSGIPRFIPPQYRKMIRGGKDPLVIQVVLSVCTLSRIILVPPRGGLKFNAQTIQDEGFVLGSITQGFGKTLSAMAVELLERYVPGLASKPFHLGFDFRPTFSSGPNTYRNPARESTVFGPGWVDKLKLSIYHTLPLDVGSLATCLDPKELMVVGAYWLRERTFIGLPAPVEPLKEAGKNFGRFILSMRPIRQCVWDSKLYLRPEAGRFGRKLEGSGKVRVFAIANPIFQALLRPLHNWVMDLLGSLRMDGTFDQHAPLRRLIGKKNLYSFDLKSATDLLPVHLSFSILRGLFGDGFSQSWLYMMTEVDFRSPDKVSPQGEIESYKFTRGQPLGYYSSWPVFSITHHMIVWLVANYIYPGKRFTDYAILGDDIVIADDEVAESYRYVMEEIQAVISLEKSLISTKGACEFAKRFIIRNHEPDRMDLSPLSIPLIRASTGYLSAFTYKFLGCSFRNSFRLRGGGYHVFSKIREAGDVSTFYRLSRRWRRHWISMFTPSGLCPLPTNLWLGFPDKGYLNCYEEGMVRQFILERVRPRDLHTEDFDRLRLFWRNDDCEYYEWFLTSYVKLHLEYLRWYAHVLCEPSLSLDYLMSPPVSPRKVERTSVESTISRYGLLFKVWDYVRCGRVPLALSCGSYSNSRTYIYALELTERYPEFETRGLCDSVASLS